MKNELKIWFSLFHINLLLWTFSNENKREPIRSEANSNLPNQLRIDMFTSICNYDVFAEYMRWSQFRIVITQFSVSTVEHNANGKQSSSAADAKNEERN